MKRLMDNRWFRLGLIVVIILLQIPFLIIASNVKSYNNGLGFFVTPFYAAALVLFYFCTNVISFIPWDVRFLKFIRKILYWVSMALYAAILIVITLLLIGSQLDEPSSFFTGYFITQTLSFALMYCLLGWEGALDESKGVLSLIQYLAYSIGVCVLGGILLSILVPALGDIAQYVFLLVPAASLVIIILYSKKHEVLGNVDESRDEYRHTPHPSRSSSSYGSSSRGSASTTSLQNALDRVSYVSYATVYKSGGGYSVTLGVMDMYKQFARDIRSDAFRVCQDWADENGISANFSIKIE